MKNRIDVLSENIVQLEPIILGSEQSTFDTKGKANHAIEKNVKTGERNKDDLIDGRIFELGPTDWIEFLVGRNLGVG